MEFNPESVLDALNDFEKKPCEISQVLEEYLLKIAENGVTLFPWTKLKPLLKRKLELVLDEFYETCPVEITAPVPNFEAFNFDTLKKSILQSVDSFTTAPFTIQRLCELVTNPKKHYNRTDKYMRGIEKNVLVVSTIESRLDAQEETSDSSLGMVNGMISGSPQDDNDCYNGHENSDNLTPTNTNSSANHVLLENFANVFPSAACIPSASNICINREIDGTFMENTECVETLEVISETTVFESSENSDTKINHFTDVTPMEQQDYMPDTSESITEVLQESSDMSYIEQSEAAHHMSDDSQSSEASSSISSDDMSSSESTRNETYSIDQDTCNVSIEKNNFKKGSECHQDDAISQSDSSSPTTVEGQTEVVTESSVDSTTKFASTVPSEEASVK